MDKEFDVVTIGMINFDINVKGFEKDMTNHKLSIVPEISVSMGGDAQNCAMTLGRMGIKTAICGRVGNDMAGTLCIGELARNHVDSSRIKRDPVCTATAINLVQSDEFESAVLYNEGSNTKFCLEDVPEEIYVKTKVMCLNSFFGCGLIGADLLRKAQDYGVITVADTTTLEPEDKLEDIEDCLPHIDYFLPSYEEAATLTKKTNPEEVANEFLARGVKHMVIKLGADGCLIKTANMTKVIPGYKVKAVDTTGCGDNFVAGFIAGLTNGLSLEECANLANAAGAINAMQLGSNGAVKSFQQLMDYVEMNK